MLVFSVPLNLSKPRVEPAVAGVAPWWHELVPCQHLSWVFVTYFDSLTYMNNFWPPSVYFSVFLMGTINLIISYNFLKETKGVNLDDVASEIRDKHEDYSLVAQSNIENSVEPQALTKK
ncbi:unnamed protein product [Strongylus vulgaris]|uniref:Uncharacterized protein n=1 Tax=Strongylus vulgaris TaxID=40348 RepID=A0A3P7JYL4_STRVU|nr:unnamed protein product [Strongylus vulgaris]